MIGLGFVLGILGSLHCLAMCGPIALALPISVGKNRVVGILSYSFGRVFTYSLIGILFGLFGSLVAFSGLQQFLSIAAGSILVAMALFFFFGKTMFRFHNPLSAKLYWLKNSLGGYLRKKSISSLFAVGLLNGLLPCGLVYIALVGAVAMGDFVLGGIYMFLFGLGTVPLLFMVAYTKEKITISWRQKMAKLTPIVVGIMGLMFVFRGLNLGIPYLSPRVSSTHIEKTSCCHKPLP